jgi:ketosteroid isomerase-like protein
MASTIQPQAAALIQKYYDTFNTGDREAFLALLTDDGSDT